MEARWLLVIATLFGIAVCSAATTVGEPVPSAREILIAPIDEAPIDLYGNEVRPAIARYKVDATGVLYEEHSPETEVPRLAPPKS